MCSVRELRRIPKDTGSDMEPIGSILFSLKLYSGRLRCFFQLFSIKAHLVEGRDELDFCLTAIVNEYSCDIPFIDVCYDYQCIYVQEGYELDIGFGKKIGTCDHFIRMIGPLTRTWLTLW
jgi:hypothetical protein